MEIKALVADSSARVRKNIARSLNELGVRKIAEAMDGDQAIELLETDTFDIVFTEWNTKLGSGDELVKSMRKANGQVPIVVTAPHSKKLEDLKKFCPTASTYLMTPFTTEQLRKAVAEYVPSIAG